MGLINIRKRPRHIVLNTVLGFVMEGIVESLEKRGQDCSRERLMNLTTKFIDENPRLIEILYTDNLETYECKIRENSRKKGLFCYFKGIVVLGLPVVVKTEERGLVWGRKLQPTLSSVGESRPTRTFPKHQRLSSTPTLIRPFDFPSPKRNKTTLSAMAHLRVLCLHGQQASAEVSGSQSPSSCCRGRRALMGDAPSPAFL